MSIILLFASKILSAIFIDSHEQMMGMSTYVIKFYTLIKHQTIILGFQIVSLVKYRGGSSFQIFLGISVKTTNRLDIIRFFMKLHDNCFRMECRYALHNKNNLFTML